MDEREQNENSHEFRQDSSHESRQENSQQFRNEYRLAGFWIRFWAYLLDVLVITFLTGIFIQPLLRLLNVTTVFPGLLMTFSFIGLLGAVYFILMTRMLGQTVGKMIFGLRVIKADGQPISWQTAIFREGIGRFLSQLFGLHLGYVWIAFHPRKRGWHDQLEDTYVVYDGEVNDKLTVKTG